MLLTPLRTISLARGRMVGRLVWVAWLAIAAVAFAGTEKRFPASSIAVSLPDGWEEIADTDSQGGLVAGFCSSDQTRVFLIFRDDQVPPAGGLDDRFVTEYEQKIESTG